MGTKPNMVATKIISYVSIFLLSVYVVSITMIIMLREDTFRLPLQQIQPVNWCKTLQLQDGKNLPVMLVSYPGSGNTWLRFLLQQASGIYTGSIYNDEYLKSMGFPGEELTDGQALVIKTHQDVNDTKKFVPAFRSAVLLMRNPRDTILSDFHSRFNVQKQDSKLQNSNGSEELKLQDINHHNKVAPPSVFRPGHASNWADHFALNLKLWENLYTDWLLNFPGPIHIVIYEQFAKDAKCVLRNTLLFLNVTVSEDDLDCALEHKDDLDAIYKRPKKYQHFDPFTNEMYQDLHYAKLRVFKLLAKCKRCTKRKHLKHLKQPRFNYLFKFSFNIIIDVGNNSKPCIP